MSIVSIKNRIALIVSATLEREGLTAKIIQSNFNEDSDNKPQMSRQVVIRHLDSEYTLQNARDQSFKCFSRFQVEVTLKDLRTDDNIQNLVDIVCRALIGASINGIPIKSLSVSNSGFDNGIWKYLIELGVDHLTNALDPDDECKLSGIESIDFVVSVFPSFNIPLGS